MQRDARRKLMCMPVILRDRGSGFRGIDIRSVSVRLYAYPIITRIMCYSGFTIEMSVSFVIAPVFIFCHGLWIVESAVYEAAYFHPKAQRSRAMTTMPPATVPIRLFVRIAITSTGTIAMTAWF